MADWSVSVPMTLSDLERRDMRVNFFQADLLNNACTVWCRTAKIGRITYHMWGGMYIHAPTEKGLGPSPRGFPSLYAYTIWRKTTKFDVVTHIGRGLFLSVQPQQWGRVPALPNFGGFLLFICAFFVAELQCTKFHMVTHVGKRRVSWGQPRLSSQESGVAALPILGFFSIYAYIL